MLGRPALYVLPGERTDPRLPPNALAWGREKQGSGAEDGRGERGGGGEGGGGGPPGGRSAWLGSGGGRRWLGLWGGGPGAGAGRPPPYAARRSNTCGRSARSCSSASATASPPGTAP